MSEFNQPRRMGSLLRHVTFKTAALGFASLFLAGLIFIYYPSEKSDQKASLSKVSVDDQEQPEAPIAQGPKAGIEVLLFSDKHSYLPCVLLVICSTCCTDYSKG